MVYYIVNKIGTGAEEDPYRPNIPDGVAWVGNDFGSIYIIGTDAAITGWIPLTDSELQNHCTYEGISYTDVANKWDVT